MKDKLVRYCIVVVCVIAILFSLYKVFSPSKKLNTYLVLGDYLSVSGNLEGKKITSFSGLLGEYFIKDNLVTSINDNYAFSNVTSGKLLEMISKDAYVGKSEGIVTAIENSKYITISVGMNDVLDYIRFDASKEKVIYDKDIIERKVEIFKQNYYEIVESIKEINEDVDVYLIGYYCPFEWVGEEYKEDVSKVFVLLNDGIKEVSDVTGVYYVDISEVSKEEHMFSKYQIYLNQLGHEYVFGVFRNNYFN